jgi:hypothetical protein
VSGLGLEACSPPLRFDAVHQLKSHSPANCQSLFDEDSYQPASKGAFVLKMRWVARCSLMAVVYCEKGLLLVATEHAASDETE